MSNVSRKRSRSIGEDGDESLPISKRINGLSLQYSTEDSNRERNENVSISQPASNGINGYDSAELSDRLSAGYNNTRVQPDNNGTVCNNSIETRNTDQHASTSSAINMPIHTDCGSNGTVPLVEDEMVYGPELDPTQNPFYYNANEILFKAHIELRTRQHNHCEK